VRSPFLFALFLLACGSPTEPEPECVPGWDAVKDNGDMAAIREYRKENPLAVCPMSWVVFGEGGDAVIFYLCERCGDNPLSESVAESRRLRNNCAADGPFPLGRGPLAL
jgi:hypothetical protein